MVCDFLTRHPNDIIRVSEDEDATALLLELGLFDKLKKESAESRAFSATGSAAVFHQLFSTHWICAVCFHGSIKKEDDGFLVLCLPKSSHSLSQAQKEYQEFMSADGGYIARSHTSPRQAPDAN